MDHLFGQLKMTDIHRDLLRNIVSFHEQEDPFDDLTDHTEERRLAGQVESDTRPLPYQSHTPEIHRPFEDAVWFNAIHWPFTSENWQKSRFSNGLFGVWYGSDTIETTVYESAYHWLRGLLCDAGFENNAVVTRRTIYSVSCNAILLDFRHLVHSYPNLLHTTDYTFTQTIAERIHHEGHPGLISMSARYKMGVNYAVLNPVVLSDPRDYRQLIYRLHGRELTVETSPGVPCMKLATDALFAV